MNLPLFQEDMFRLGHPDARVLPLEGHRTSSKSFASSASTLEGLTSMPKLLSGGMALPFSDVKVGGFEQVEHFCFRQLLLERVSGRLSLRCLCNVGCGPATLVLQSKVA